MVDTSKVWHINDLESRWGCFGGKPQREAVNPNLKLLHYSSRDLVCSNVLYKVCGANLLLQTNEALYILYHFVT
jgi:hypothetical protein